MSSKVFAPDIERDSQGRYIFPKDQEWRRELLHPDAMSHPGKNNMYQVEALVNYLTEPGDLILDPFGGVGSLVPVAASARNNLVLIEIEPVFVEMLKWAKDKYGHIAVYEGDCRLVLPIACDHAIFSPPFANSITNFDLTANKAEEYSTLGVSSNLNLGLLNEFIFTRAMIKVYGKLAQSVRPGGRVAIITRDSAREGAKQAIVKSTIRDMTRTGFKHDEWLIRLVGESLRARYNKQQGWGVNENEDMLLFTRE
jgi:hypothetical protein